MEREEVDNDSVFDGEEKKKKKEDGSTIFTTT